MELTLSAAQLESARKELLADDSSMLIDLMFCLNLHLSTNEVPARIWRKATALGWVDPQSRTVTNLGGLVADTTREYKFWLERGRLLHAERDYSLLAAEGYSGKTVLEVGSGFGCNLLSLSLYPGRFLGIEPVALYRQLTSIFAEREGLPCPNIIDGSGEHIPLDKNTVDVVLCYSTHQYMDVRRALLEMSRVLKPGGQLRIMGGTFGQYFFEEIQRIAQLKRARELPTYALTIINTLFYEGFGRRLYIPGGYSATTAPIYPSVAAMCRWLNRAGLVYRADLSRCLPGDMCFIADRPLV